MSLTTDFRDGPLEFLKKYILVVEDGSEGDPKSEPENFCLSPANSKEAENNYVFLKRKMLIKPKDVISAYWLPWKKGIANNLTLGDKAKFMFTSELTNCRFSVLTGDMANPRVAHVEGTKSSNARDELEVTALFPSRDEDNKGKKLMRRLSVTGLKNLTKDPNDTGKTHNYYGQDGAEKTSAFVFGYRADKTWKFYAQIVKGVMAGTTQDSLKVATKKVVPYDEAYEIA